MHYHLSQHGVFSEKEMRFYASEIILGLEHMHTRFVVYRDLKVRRAPTPSPLWPLFSAVESCPFLPIPALALAKLFTE